MIETLMALWNRGMKGRLTVMVVTFFCLCISISLLFVTLGGVWGSLQARGRPAGEETPASNALVITATAPPSVVATATVGATSTPILVPNPCLASPTGAHINTPRAYATGSSGQRDVPTRAATSRPLRKRPTPGATVLPSPSPTASPTLPAVTPTATTPPTITPGVTNTPVSTPTVTVAPTATTTPGATPTPTPTIPGGTPTVGTVSTPGTTPTATAVTSPTVTAPVSSPTVTISVTSGMGSRQVHDGRPPVANTPAGVNNDQQSEGSCLGDTLMTGGEAMLFSRLRSFFWTVLGTSLLGTSLFCTQMYRLSRRSQQREF